MLEKFKSYYLKKKVKQEVDLFYIALGINPKELENLTMQEILKKVEYAMQNLVGWREEYYKTLDTMSNLNGEIAHLKAKFKDYEQQIDVLKGENTKLKIRNDFLTQECKTYQIINGKMMLKELRQNKNVVSYERG